MLFNLRASKKNIVHPNQSGFKAGHSMETALVAVTEELHTARGASLSSIAILLDLSAAFYTENLQILLSTIQELGISDSTLILLTS